jgi:hypothetical protein
MVKKLFLVFLLIVLSSFLFWKFYMYEESAEESYVGEDDDSEDDGKTFSGTEMNDFLGDDSSLWMHPNNKGWAALKKNSPEEWDVVLDNIEGFGIFGANIKNKNQQEVTDALSILRERNIRIAVEVGGLRPFACTGEDMAKREMEIFDKLYGAGYSDFVVRIDAPFTFTSVNAFHENDCKHSWEKTAEEMVDYIDVVGSKYPEAEFYWNEPTGMFSFGEIRSNNENRKVGDLKQIIPIVFREADNRGVNLKGFIADNSLRPVINHPDDGGWLRLVEIQRAVNRAGKDFSILLNYAGDRCPGCTNGGFATDEEFYLATLGYYDCFLAKGGKLDLVYPESWWKHPQETLPEEQQYTFANLMLAFIERINNENYVASCDFVNNVFVPEEWGTSSKYINYTESRTR